MYEKILINLLSAEEQSKFISKYSHNVSINDVLIYEKYFQIKYESTIICPTINLTDTGPEYYENYLKANTDDYFKIKALSKCVKMFEFCIMDKNISYGKAIIKPRKRRRRFTRKQREKFFETFEATRTFQY